MLGRCTAPPAPSVPLGQPDLFGPAFVAIASAPKGLSYTPDLLSTGEEAELMAAFSVLPFAPFQFHGYEGNRRVVAFGSRWDFDVEERRPAPPLPGFLVALRKRVADCYGLDDATISHALVSEYAPGAGIGWHVDRPPSTTIMGVSFGAVVPFRLKRRGGDGWERYTFRAEPRSVYRLAGEARTQWLHSIPPTEALRYSVTFRLT